MKYQSYIYTLIIIFFCRTSLLAISDFDPKVYDNFIKSDTLVMEDFYPKSTAVWEKEGSIGNVINDVFFIHNQTDSIKWQRFYNKKSIDVNRAFEIELSLNFMDHRGVFQFLWGANFSKYGMLFELKSRTIGIHRGGSPFTINEYSVESNDYQTGDYKLSIRKVGDKYLFFVNQFFFHEMWFDNFDGEYFYFSVWPNTKVTIDYISICYLDSLKGKNHNLDSNMIFINKMDTMNHVESPVTSNQSESEKENNHSLYNILIYKIKNEWQIIVAFIGGILGILLAIKKLMSRSE